MSHVLELDGSFHLNDGPALSGTLTVTRDVNFLNTLGPRPDKGWSFRDKAGHFHAYSIVDDRYPTLWEEDYHCESEHLDGDAWWCECRTDYKCRICKEIITPGMVQGPHSEARPGLASWEVYLDYMDMAAPEVGAMVTMEAKFLKGTLVKFGVAVVTSVRVWSPVANRTNVLVVLAGAGPLGEKGKR